jgi:hypothetical protein
MKYLRANRGVSSPSLFSCSSDSDITNSGGGRYDIVRQSRFLNVRNDRQETALHALLRGNRDTMEAVKMAVWLLEHGVQGDARDVNGETGLHVSARNGREDFLEVLLKKGCDPTLPDARERLPRQCIQDGELATLYQSLVMRPKTAVALLRAPLSRGARDDHLSLFVGAMTSKSLTSMQNPFLKVYAMNSQKHVGKRLYRERKVSRSVCIYYI